MIPALRAWSFLVRYSFARQIRSRKVPLSAFLLALIAALVVVAGIWKPWTARFFTEWVILRLLGLFLLPLVSLMFGTGALADERDEGTLVYLVTKPLWRSAIYAGKLLAAAPIVLLFAIGGLALLCLLGTMSWSGGTTAFEVFEMFWAPLFWGSLAYVSFFHFLGVAFRHSTIIGLAYVFIVEVFVGRAPGILKRISISFYTWSMVYGEDPGFEVAFHPREVFLPVADDTARTVLQAIVCGFFILGAFCFSRREYRDAV